MKGMLKMMLRAMLEMMLRVMLEIMLRMKPSYWALVQRLLPRNGQMKAVATWSFSDTISSYTV